MIPETTPQISLKGLRPEFDPKADHALNLVGALGYVQSQFQMCSQLSNLTDGRRSNASHPFENMISLLFTMHLLQRPSLNRFLGPGFEDEFENGTKGLTSSVENCCRKMVTGRSGTVKSRPSRSAVDNTLAKLNADEIREINFNTIERAIELGIIEEGAVEGRVIAAIDGSQTFTSQSKSCGEHCQIKDHRNGTREYLHRCVLASLVLAGGNLALDCELLKGADSARKGEAEISGAKSMLPRLMERFPDLIDIVTADALYPCGPMVNLAQELGFTLVARIKNDRRKPIKDSRLRFDSGSGNSKTFVAEDQAGERVLVTAHWVDDFIMDGTDKPVRVVRFLELPLLENGQPDLTLDPETGEPARLSEAWLIVSSDDLSVELLWKVMHLRWRIENNCFHQLKTYYHLDHLYSHQGAAASIALIILAFNARELYQLRYTLYNRSGKWCTKLKLTDKFKADLARENISRFFQRTSKQQKTAA